MYNLMNKIPKIEEISPSLQLWNNRGEVNMSLPV